MNDDKIADNSFNVKKHLNDDGDNNNWNEEAENKNWNREADDKYPDKKADDTHWDEEADNVDIEQITQNAHVPRDHGWAWFVLLGATLEMFLQLGIVKSAGILFVAFQEKFHSSSSVTSLLSTVQNICQSLTAFLVMTCGIKLTSYRNLVFFGSSISCIAYVITSQATDIRVLLFSHGVLQGIGVGTALPATVTMVSLYFEKRRGLANSIAVSGGPVGGAVFASLITHLLATYGYQGCVLVVAGILLNGCVSGAFFRPTSFYTDRKARQKLRDVGKEVEEERQKFISNHKMQKHSNLDIMSLKKGDLILDHESLPASDHFSKVTFEKSPNNFTLEYRKQENSVYTDIVKSQKTHKLLETSEDTFHSFDVNTSVESINEQINREDDKNDLKRHIFCKYFNFQLLTNPLFLAFLLQGSFIASGTLVAPIFIVPYARDINVSTEDIATLVTTQSCIDLFARLLIGYISDKNWVRRSTIVATASMVVAVSSSLLRFYTTFPLLLGYSVVLGLVSGVYFSLYTVVLIDYLTLQNFQTSLGFMSLVHGFSIAAVFYLVGYLRDISGSYIVPHQVIGATTGIGSIIMFLMPVIQRLQKK